MRFFTPELYLRYSSRRDATAEVEWEEAVRAYHAHLGQFSTEMKDRVRELAEDVCLHDAELLSLWQEITAPPVPPTSWASVAIISLRDNGRIINLFYLSWGEVGLSTAPQEWPLSRLHPRWLCDEIDREPGPAPIRRYHHRILLSDGREISIPFCDVVVHSFSEQAPETALITRRRA